jgi:hypothetical protein
VIRMNRRTFLKTGFAGSLAWYLGDRFGYASGSSSAADREIPKGFPIWDDHAHPHSFFSNKPDPTTPTIAMMKEAGIAGCVFTAVGDAVLNVRGSSRGTNPKMDTARQLDRVKEWVKSGDIKMIRTASDLDRLTSGEPGSIVGPGL